MKPILVIAANGSFISPTMSLRILDSCSDGMACQICFNGGEMVQVIASNGLGWDHVSVCAKNRVPTWEEMCKVKDFFFEPEECVMQLHPPQSQYVNCHPYVLHLWRPQNLSIPMPPVVMV